MPRKKYELPALRYKLDKESFICLAGRVRWEMAHYFKIDNLENVPDAFLFALCTERNLDAFRNVNPTKRGDKAKWCRLRKITHSSYRDMMIDLNRRIQKVMRRYEFC